MIDRGKKRYCIFLPAGSSYGELALAYKTGIYILHTVELQILIAEGSRGFLFFWNLWFLQHIANSGWLSPSAIYQTFSPLPKLCYTQNLSQSRVRQNKKSLSFFHRRPASTGRKHSNKNRVDAKMARHQLFDKHHRKKRRNLICGVNNCFFMQPTKIKCNNSCDRNFR